VAVIVMTIIVVVVGAGDVLASGRAWKIDFIFLRQW